MTPIDARMAALASSGRSPAPPAPGLAEVALAATAAEPGRVIVTDGNRSLTRRALMDMALALGAGLAAQGVTRGAAVAFQLPNWWEACVINLAAALFGWRVVPLLTIYRRAELETILAACEVEVLFIPDAYRGTDHAALVAGLDARPRLVIEVRGDGGFEALLSQAPGRPDPAPGADCKLVIFTSGSTGRPKGVIHTHDAIGGLIRRTAEFWGITGDDRLYVPSPIGHIGGMIYAFEFPWITGCVARMEETWQPDRAVAAIDAEGLTFVAGATPFLQGLIEAADRAGSDLPSLTRFICGGASVPPALVTEGLARFPNAVVSRAYGSSEVPLVCPGIRTRAEAALRADTDGETGVRVRLLDGPGPDEGEIAVEGPQMFAGYLDARDEAGAFTDDGFHRMGDLGRRIDGRFLVITGRKKDIIIRKGENISPVEIENALLAHPAVAACAVVGRPDPERGELVVAFVVTEPGAGFDMAAMIRHLEARGLARQKFPEELRLIAALPMNAVGKVQKPELRALAAAAP